MKENIEIVWRKQPIDWVAKRLIGFNHSVKHRQKSKSVFFKETD